MEDNTLHLDNVFLNDPVKKGGLIVCISLIKPNGSIIIDAKKTIYKGKVDHEILKHYVKYDSKIQSDAQA